VCCRAVVQILVLVWGLTNAYFFLLMLLAMCGVYGAHRYNKWFTVGVRAPLFPDARDLSRSHFLKPRLFARSQYAVYICANVVLRIYWMTVKPTAILIILLGVGMIFEVCLSLLPSLGVPHFTLLLLSPQFLAMYLTVKFIRLLFQLKADGELESHFRFL
jgi:hypothetical protein